MKTVKTKRLVESAVLLALGFVLSTIKLKMGLNGGSITLVSMLPMVLLAYKYGSMWGMLCGGVHGLIQMFEGGLYAPPTKTFFSYVLVILLDYLFAWAVVGLLAGLVGKVLHKNPRLAVTIGSALGIFGRFLCSFASGVIIWGVYAPEGQSAVLYSLIQNGIAMLPEMILTSVVAFILLSFTAMRQLLVVETNA